MVKGNGGPITTNNQAIALNRTNVCELAFPSEMCAQITHEKILRLLRTKFASRKYRIRLRVCLAVCPGTITETLP